MSTKQDGDWGEALVEKYLSERGCRIVEREWRCRFGEIDLIAWDKSVLCFVEVKTRRAGSLTPPEAAVTPQKFRALTRAAVRYLAATGGQEEAQFDLAAVDVMPDGRMEVRLVEQAMEYNW